MGRGVRAASTLPVIAGLAVDEREVLVTTPTQAVPDLREEPREPSIWPFVSALTVSAVLLGSIFTPWAIA